MPLAEKRELHPWLFLGGCALVLNAGFINTVAFLGFHSKFVSHMTGNVAQVGLQLSRGAMSEALDALLLVVAFVLGAVVNGLLIGSTNFSLNERYGVVLTIQCTALGVALLFLRHFGADTIHFGEYLVATVCGMQNSMTTIYSSAVIRTTHLTGSLTDLGSEIGHWLRGDRSATWKIGLFSASAAAFVVGSALGVTAFGRWQIGSLWFSAGLYAALALSVAVGHRLQRFRSIAARG